MKYPPRVLAMAEAIKAYEGWSPSSLSARNNNPGNLRRWGNTPIKNGYACFPTYDAGWRALCTLITNAASGKSRIYHPHDSLQQFFSRYAPASDDNYPLEYARFVAKRLGVSPNIPIGWLLLTESQKPPSEV